jgi:hypothetical protein
MMRASDPRPHPHRWKECRDRRGDRIEARRNGFTHYFGRVEQAFPEEGTVLIIEGVGRQRKLLHRDEYILHRSYPLTSGGSPEGWRL